MLKSPFLFAVSLLVAWLGPTLAAQASSPALDFSLPQASAVTPTPSSDLTAAPAAAPTPLGVKRIEPLPVPLAASRPPVRQAQSLARLVPPSPTPQSIVLPPIAAAPKPETPAAFNSAAPIELNFELAAVAPAAMKQPAATNAIISLTSGETVSLSSGDTWIFRGGSDSLVARTVGSAEGTRGANGNRNQAYYGHSDPGNGVWNLGTFSYQHGARSPEEADEKQLHRLESQAKVLDQKAQAAGLKLSLVEKLNGVDLANQAPLAALDRGGYVERLAEAHKLGMSDREAILYARTWAYIDPDTQRWNAPGLGNNVYSISRDQERRIDAIAAAMGAYEQADSLSTEAPSVPVSTPVVNAPTSSVQPASSDEPADVFQLPRADSPPPANSTVPSGQAAKATRSHDLRLPAALTPAPDQPDRNQPRLSRTKLAAIAPTPLAAGPSDPLSHPLAAEQSVELQEESVSLVDQFILQDVSSPLE